MKFKVARKCKERSVKVERRRLALRKNLSSYSIGRNFLYLIVVSNATSNVLYDQACFKAPKVPVKTLLFCYGGTEMSKSRVPIPGFSK